MRLLGQLQTFYFFYEKILHALKALKAQKALEALSSTNTPGQKHKNANKQISDCFPLRCFLGAFFYFCLLVSVLCFLVVVKSFCKIKIEFKTALMTSFLLLLWKCINIHAVLVKMA